MPGAVIIPVPKRTVTFTGLATGQSREIILADRVDTFGWREVTVLVDIHSYAIGAGAGFIKFIAYSQSVSAEDPGMQFVETNDGSSAFISDGSPSPGYLTFMAPLSPLIRLVAFATRLGAGALNAQVSIELSLKDATTPPPREG